MHRQAKFKIVEDKYEVRTENKGRAKLGEIEFTNDEVQAFYSTVCKFLTILNHFQPYRRISAIRERIRDIDFIGLPWRTQVFIFSSTISSFSLISRPEGSLEFSHWLKGIPTTDMLRKSIETERVRRERIKEALK